MNKEHQPSAQDSAAPSSLSAEPIYQVRNSFLSDPPNVWRDAEVFAYDVSPEEDRRILFGTPPAQAPAIQAPEVLQELHGLLYLAQRTTGEAQAESIGKARLLLSRLRDVPQAEPDLTEDGAIWKAIIAWADARNSAHAVSGGHAAAVDSAIRAATTEECPYCHDCWPECLHCDGTGRAVQAPSLREACAALLSLIRRDAPHLSGKVLGDAEAALATPSAAVSAGPGALREAWADYKQAVAGYNGLLAAHGEVPHGAGAEFQESRAALFAAVESFLATPAPAPTQPQPGTGSES
jgi:hypothetical protein